MSFTNSFDFEKPRQTTKQDKYDPQLLFVLFMVSTKKDLSILRLNCPQFVAHSRDIWANVQGGGFGCADLYRI